jgi:Ca2+/Na+ antiporter
MNFVQLNNIIFQPTVHQAKSPLNNTVARFVPSHFLQRIVVTAFNILNLFSVFFIILFFPYLCLSLNFIFSVSFNSTHKTAGEYTMTKPSLFHFQKEHKFPCGYIIIIFSLSADKLKILYVYLNDQQRWPSTCSIGTWLLRHTVTHCTNINCFFMVRQHWRA